MPTYVEIFLRPLRDRELDSLVTEVAGLAGVELRSGPEIYGGQVHAGVIGDSVAIEFWPDSSDLDDLAELPFSTHPYMIEFRPLGVSVDDARRAMDGLYELIKRTGNYSMFATFDAEHLLRTDVRD